MTPYSDLNATRLLRIKRANTDWWINEKSVVGANGLTYIAYFTDMGEIHVKELDAKCSKTPSHDICLCRLNYNYADEHNSPSICIMESGKIMVVYTGHGVSGVLRYRITEKPYDIFSFGAEHTLYYQASVTYAQLFENATRHELWLFTRVAGVTWEFIYSADEGETWSKPTCFLKSDAGGLFYFDVRKQLVADRGSREQWFFALYGHPRISKDHTIRAGFFDADGTLCMLDGTQTDINLFGNSPRSAIAIEELEPVYASPEGTTVRLLEVAPTLPYRVGLATFELDKPETITYYIASYHDGWKLSAPICKGGEFLSAPPQLDGSQTYVGGMACYYGVGFAGIGSNRIGSIDTDRVYIARLDTETNARVLESYISTDNGENYRLEDTLRSLPCDGRSLKIWRPIVPIFAQDNLPVYWHEGIYSAHTGGWHCDAVMLVEYDD